MALYEKTAETTGYLVQTANQKMAERPLSTNMTEPLLGEEETEEYEVRFSSRFDLWIKCESQRQQHRLSVEYFDHWEYWTNFFPMTILTLVIAIASFLVGTDIFDDKIKNYVSIGVGVIASLSVAIQNNANHNKYATRAAMHEQASLSLKKLADAVEFTRFDPKRSSGKRKEGPIVESSSGNNLVESTLSGSNQDQVETYRKVYDQCLLSCASSLPLRISQPFLLVESRLAMGLRDRKFQETVRDKLGGKMDDPDGRMTIYESAYDEVFCSISNANGWPW